MGRVFTLNQVQDVLRVRRRVIFTHGSFDLCHIGHVSLLRESKRLGGILVVGVDSDKSVRACKGVPAVFDQDHRARLIAQFDFVDYVLPLRTTEGMRDIDYYYLRLYLLLRPAIITFGTNFPYIKEVEEKCRVASIKSRRIRHEYSTRVSTSAYAHAMARKYIESDFGLFTNSPLFQ